MWMGWDEMGGKELSYPTRSLPISELPPRHRAVALPSPNRKSQHPSRWISERGYMGRQAGPGGAKCAGKAGARSASFCKRHGGLSSVCGPWARLRTSLSSCTPRAKNLPQVSVVDRCGWDPAMLRARYTSCTGHSDLFFPVRTAPSHIKSLQRPLIAHTSAVGHHQHLLKGT